MSALYEKESYALDKAINDYLDANPGVELTPEIVTEIVHSVDSNIQQNIENICKYIKKLEHDIDFAKWEIERINEFKTKSSKKMEGLKGYLLDYVVIKGKQQVGTFTISSRKSSKVDVLNIEELGEDYKTEEVVIKIDKALIKKACNDLGITEIPGARLVTNNNLQLK